MAYIAKKKNREGKYYVYLIEGYREGGKVKQRTLKNYGSLEVLEKNEPGAYERLRKEAKLGIIGKKEEKEIIIKLDLNEPINSNDLFYGWKILDDIYEGLEISEITNKVNKKTKIDSNMDKVLRLLVYERILNPDSKLSTVTNQKNLYGNWDLDINTVYRCLDKLSSKSEEIQLKVHETISKKIGREATLVFYDVTNYYFETDIDDVNILDEEGQVIKEGLRKRGPSKEKRPNPIVQLGLFMDTNGIPISYRLFKGNQTDPVTYIPAIEQVKKQFGIERIIIVADKAMNSKSNIDETLKNGDGWLFSQKHRGKRGASKNIQEFILDKSGWEYNESITFGKKSMIHERKLSKDKTIKEKVLVIWSKKYADREKIRRDGALKYAQLLTNAEIYRQVCKKGGKKYINLFTKDKETGKLMPFSPFIDIDIEEVKFDEQFDGINVIVTSEIDMDDEQILNSYKELSKIEDCFRITKTELHTRPVYVWKNEHIKAHFLTCFLALVIVRILQNYTKWALSPEKLIKALQSARMNQMKQGYCRVQANEDLVAILDTLGIKWEKSYVKVETLKEFGKGWFTT